MASHPCPPLQTLQPSSWLSYLFAACPGYPFGLLCPHCYGSRPRRRHHQVRSQHPRPNDRRRHPLRSPSSCHRLEVAARRLLLLVLPLVYPCAGLPLEARVTVVQSASSLFGTLVRGSTQCVCTWTTSKHVRQTLEIESSKTRLPRRENVSQTVDTLAGVCFACAFAAIAQSGHSNGHSIHNHLKVYKACFQVPGTVLL